MKKVAAKVLEAGIYVDDNGKPFIHLDLKAIDESCGGFFSFPMSRFDEFNAFFGGKKDVYLSKLLKCESIHIIEEKQHACIEAIYYQDKTLVV